MVIKQAMDFIHTSDLKYHGAFSKQCCLIDERYSLRVVQAGFLHLLSLMSRHHGSRCSAPKNDAVDVIEHQQKDIEALGLFLAEIFEIELSPSGTKNGICNIFA